MQSLKQEIDQHSEMETGQPSVLVASFSDRQKAEAFAKEVDGEVGEP